MKSNRIHPTAYVDPKATLGEGNEIGPHVVIEGGVSIGDGNRILANAYLCEGTSMGHENEVYMGAVIGGVPQDRAFEGDPSFTEIGSRNIIREYVTINRGTKAGTKTLIGDDNFLMTQAHVAHNCQIGNHVTLVNVASLTGYCVVEDDAFLSGMTGLHQFTRVGRLVMLSALSAVNKDIPPYMICGGRPAVVIGVNVVGLRRVGMKPAVRREIQDAYKILYKSNLRVSNALEEIKRTFHSAEVTHLVNFIETSKRGICRGGSDEEETLLSRTKKTDASELPQMSVGQAKFDA